MSAINVLGYLACIYFAVVFLRSVWVYTTWPDSLLWIRDLSSFEIKWWALAAAIAGGVIGVMA